MVEDSGVSCDSHEMELRSQCSGHHFSLMQGNAPPAMVKDPVPLSPEASSPSTNDLLYLGPLKNAPLLKLLTPESSPRSDDLYNMELRSQCTGLHYSLFMEPYAATQQLPHPSDEDSLADSPHMNGDKVDIPLLSPHVMELRSQCQGIHESLMCP